MTRLFLRFYFGVVLILVAALMILGYVFGTRSGEDDIRVIELALGGGARVARDQIVSAAEDQTTQAFANIQANFDYPVRIIDRQKRPMSMSMTERVNKGEPVLRGDNIVIAIPDSTDLLEFGPLPRFGGPSQTAQTVGLGAIFSLAAIAIAILLRPVVSQLRAVETAATAIAAGELSTRIESRRWRRPLPLESSFNLMAERTESLLESQKELLQAVSHELRTPLSRIRFATDLIETSRSDEERRQRLDAVDNATQELDELVGELLTYVRLDSDTIRDEVQQIEVQELLLEQVALRGPLHPDVAMSVAVTPNPLTLTASRSEISRAVGNLLSNAAKFAAGRVRLSAAQRGGSLIVTVDDDGPGVPMTDRERVFEPFVRLEDSTAKRGSGLGLALVHRIARRQGGRVSVGESALGGACFQLMLPISC